MLADQNLKIATQIDKISSEIIQNQFDSLIAIKSHLNTLENSINKLDDFIQEIEDYKKEIKSL